MAQINKKVSSLGIKLLIIFYVFMMVTHYFVLYFDTGIVNHFTALIFNHTIKILISIPIWLLFFRYLIKISVLIKIILHLIILPGFCALWLFTYYTLCDIYGLYHLQGPRQVWDFYLAGLFYIIQFGSIHLYNYYKSYKQQLLLESELRELALKSELSALKAQLNPHFLYNIFNTINAAIPPEAERTRNMVAKLSDLFRYQLKASKEEFVTIQEELSFVKNYLDLEKERFGDRINYYTLIDKEALDKAIPPLLLQPLVENSVKHGLSSLIEGGEIKITIKVEKESIVFSILDTGIGLQDKSNPRAVISGIGISNTNARLLKMFDSKLSFHPHKPRGLEVKFSIPVIRI